MVPSGKLNQRRSRFPLDVRRIDDGQLAERQPHRGDRVEQFECLGSDRLIQLIIAEYGPAVVGRNDFGRLEVFAGDRKSVV